MTILLVVLLGGLGLWLSPQLRRSMLEPVATALDEATKGTPLEGFGKHVRDTDAAKEVPPTDSLSGAEIRGSITRGTTLPEGEFQKEGKNIIGKVLEDTRLKKDFVWDLASYLVSHYAPRAKPGDELCTLPALNSYLGARLNIESQGGRSALMRYIFQPTMLKGLYHLYITYFFDVLKYRLEQQYLKADIPAFYALMEQRIGACALAVTAILASPDLDEQLEAYEKLDDVCEDLEAKMSVARYDLDQMSDESAVMRTHMQDRLDALNIQAKYAIEQRNTALRTMIDDLHMEPDAVINDANLLFLARWVQRRLRDEGGSRESVETAVQILFDLQIRFRQKAESFAVVTEKTPSSEEEESGASLLDDTVFTKHDAKKQTQEEPMSQRRGEAYEPEAEKEPVSSADTNGVQGSAETEPTTSADARVPQQEQGEPPVNDGLPQTIQIPILPDDPR
ncbi:MAG: hypothetical protein IJS54_01750 [Desulfovibrio sp.]|nr:hypothetical protein [Desulfovibrio sp.]